MKINLSARILLSTLFYATVLSTASIMSPVLVARDDAPIATVDGAGAQRNARVWEHALEAPAKAEPDRHLRLPRSDAPIAGPAARQAPIYYSGPDAAMIKPGKVRAKTIKL